MLWEGSGDVRARSTASFNCQVVSIWHASASSYPHPCWILLEGFQLSPKSFACVCTNPQAGMRTHTAGQPCQSPFSQSCVCPHTPALPSVCLCDPPSCEMLLHALTSHNTDRTRVSPTSKMYLCAGCTLTLPLPSVFPADTLVTIAHGDKAVGHLTGFFTPHSALPQPPVPFSTQQPQASWTIMSLPSTSGTQLPLDPEACLSLPSPFLRPPTPTRWRGDPRLPAASGHPLLLSPQSEMLFPPLLRGPVSV